MARKKSDKIIHLITESFESGIVDTLQNLEPGPVHLLSGDTPDGPGIYVCDQPFTIEEAEAQHNISDLLEDPEAELEEIEVPFEEE